MDAALDFPLFYKLPAVANGMAPVETLRHVFEDRKAAQKELLSTHGEAGLYYGDEQGLDGTKDAEVLVVANTHTTERFASSTVSDFVAACRSVSARRAERLCR